MLGVEWPTLADIVFIGTPAFISMLTWVCLRPWNVTLYPSDLVLRLKRWPIALDEIGAPSS